MSVHNGWSGGVWLPLVLAGLLAGCSINVTKTPPPPNPSLIERYEGFLRDGEAARMQGEIDRAIALNREANKVRPTEAEPWRRIAQLEFARRNYSAAIAGALEVTRRDQNDPMANSILLVGGLRVATAAMEHLRDADRLPGSAKPDAQALTRTLRERLGEQVLVPSEFVPGQASSSRSPSRPGPASRSNPSGSRSASEPTSGRSSGRSGVSAPSRPDAGGSTNQRPGSSSPFSILK